MTRFPATPPIRHPVGHSIQWRPQEVGHKRKSDKYERKAVTSIRTSLFHINARNVRKHRRALLISARLQLTTYLGST